jgi:hypothetical protein
MKALVLLLTVLAAVLSGCAIARLRMGRWLNAAAFVWVYMLSTLYFCTPYFLEDPSTWWRTYYSGLQGCVVLSNVFHVVPALLAFSWMRARLRSNAAAAGSGTGVG